jgi:hypothetical protein
MLYHTLVLGFHAIIYVVVRGALRSVGAGALLSRVWEALCFIYVGYTFVGLVLGGNSGNVAGGGAPTTPGRTIVTSASARSVTATRRQQEVALRHDQLGGVARSLSPALEASDQAQSSAGDEVPVDPATLAAALGVTLLDDAVTCRPFQHTFDAPFEQVVAALAAKYRPPHDPENPYVREVRPLALSEQAGHTGPGAGNFGGDGGVTHQHREIIIGLEFLPWPLNRMELQVDELWKLHHGGLAPGRELELGSQPAHRPAHLLYSVANRNLRSHGIFQELARYRPHPSRQGCTLYESVVQMKGSTYLARKVSTRDITMSTA